MTIEEAKDKELDMLLQQEQVKQALHYKVLILGAGESGKSTIVKQLVFIHKNAKLPLDEKKTYISVLHSNTLSCMTTLIREAVENYGLESKFSEEEKIAIDSIKDHEQREVLTPDVAETLEMLWRSPTIQEVWAKRSQYWHLEATEYYFKNASRFAESDFIPSEEDIIMARKRTTGVVVTEMDYGDVHWSVVDVGGQRSERRKWINCFDDVKAIIYVENLAGYAKVLFEDKNVLRMQESLDLFESVMKNPLFKDTPVFLFLNKKDLFEDMIKTKNIDVCFPDYTGPPEFTACRDFIAKKYSERLPASRKQKPFVISLAARVKKDVQYAFEEVHDRLLDIHQKDIARAHNQQEKLEKQHAKIRVKLDRDAEEREAAQKYAMSQSPGAVPSSPTPPANTSTAGNTAGNTNTGTARPTSAEAGTSTATGAVAPVKSHISTSENNTVEHRKDISSDGTATVSLKSNTTTSTTTVSVRVVDGGQAQVTVQTTTAKTTTEPDGSHTPPEHPSVVKPPRETSKSDVASS